MDASCGKIIATTKKVSYQSGSTHICYKHHTYMNLQFSNVGDEEKSMKGKQDFNQNS